MTSRRPRATILIAFTAAAALSGEAAVVAAPPPPKGLQVHWVDVEGGAATLFVTPAGESVLVDTGFPGDRDASRIRALLEAEGLSRIDHLIVTHYHMDHFGGLPDLVKRLPVGTLYERPVDSAPEKERTDARIAAYRAIEVGKRVPIVPGARLPLRQARKTAPLSFQFLGASETFIPPKGARANPACAAREARTPDVSDNRNSAVMLITFGAFRMFDGGDLTWNTEGDLVCPRDRVGAVDVYQVNHHGADTSNNPVLVRTLAPTVAIVNNGPRKGGGIASFATLKATPSIAAIYQLHRNVAVTAAENTAPELTANQDEACAGHPITMTVEPSGRRYTVHVASTGHSRTYETRRR